jgi:hypothetical protein
MNDTPDAPGATGTPVTELGEPLAGPAFEKGLWRVLLGGTIAFTVTALAATAFGGVIRGIALVVALVLFAVGVAAFGWAYFTAVGRSRRDEMLLPGLFFLSGSVDKAVQRRVLALDLVQIAVGLATASIRTYSTLAFGILVPMFGAGLTGLWGARLGRFPARVVTPRKRSARSSSTTPPPPTPESRIPTRTDDPSGLG